jgi:hypothetical protein
MKPVHVCHLDYLLSQGTTKKECALNFKKRIFPYQTILKKKRPEKDMHAS